MVITDFLIKNAELFADDVALVEVNPGLREEPKKTWKDFELVEATPLESYRREISWKVFDEKANRFSNLLISAGFTKGKRVAILLMNCLEWLPIYFGVLKTGALVIPLNYRYTSDEIKYCLELAEADALVFGPEFKDRVDAIKDALPRVSCMYYVGTGCPAFAQDYYALCAEQPMEFTAVPLKEEDDAALYFSSGTTGFPKAILHTQGSLVSACYTENNHHAQTKDDVFLCIPPLYHTGAKMHWFGSLLVGGKGVILRGVKPEWIMRAASDEKATIVWLLVPWAQDILDAISSGEIKLDEYDLSHWRLMHIGAQPVPPSLIKRWQAVFPNHKYDTNYGLSESMGPGCVHLGMDNIHKVGAIGKPGYKWSAMIADERGVPVKRGEVGELAVKGPGVMKCYYNDPKATAEVLRGDWLFTGDMAKEDEDGFIFLVDRKKDVIITGGENLYPVQIEDYLRGCDDIKDVAVIGLPDKRLGEIAAAVVELKPGSNCTREDIESFCEGLTRYKRPRRIIFDKVPRNPTGKIEKPKLREKYCSESVVELQIKG